MPEVPEDVLADMAERFALTTGWAEHRKPLTYVAKPLLDWLARDESALYELMREHLASVEAGVLADPGGLY